MTKENMPESWEQRFDERFPHKISEVIDDFGSSTKSDLKEFIAQERAKAASEVVDWIDERAQYSCFADRNERLMFQQLLKEARSRGESNEKEV